MKTRPVLLVEKSDEHADNKSFTTIFNSKEIELATGILTSKKYREATDLHDIIRGGFFYGAIVLSGQYGIEGSHSRKLRKSLCEKYPSLIEIQFTNAIKNKVKEIHDECKNNTKSAIEILEILASRLPDKYMGKLKEAIRHYFGESCVLLLSKKGKDVDSILAF